MYANDLHWYTTMHFPSFGISTEKVDAIEGLKCNWNFLVCFHFFLQIFLLCIVLILLCGVALYVHRCELFIHSAFEILLEIGNAS